MVKAIAEGVGGEQKTQRIRKMTPDKLADMIERRQATQDSEG